MSYYYSTTSLQLCLAAFAFVLYKLCRFLIQNPLHELDGPPTTRLLGGHMSLVLDPGRSPHAHEHFAREYGRNVRIKGIHPWDVRLLPMDPISVAHVLKNSMVYEKPCTKRQRRVTTPAFSVQNMRALVPLVFSKGEELKDRWTEMIDARTDTEETEEARRTIVLDACHWISRATFDVIGLAGFDYQFNAIQNESNELFCAYKDMFEVAISQGQSLNLTHNLLLYAKAKRPSVALRADWCKKKKVKIEEGMRNGKPYEGKDLLTLLLKSNAATDLPSEQRISDDDILHNINTFMFAGSDTTSLALTWTLLLLAKYPDLQTRLRHELLAIRPLGPHATLTVEEIESLYAVLSALPFLDNICRESLRLIPPVHSSLRVAIKDDVVPVSEPFVVEALNLDKVIWGADAWQFNPDRWDNLPEAAAALPGLYSNMLTFSAGPRSCIGQRFSMIEMKTFLYILLTNFVFEESGEKVVKANVFHRRRLTLIMGSAPSKPAQPVTAELNEKYQSRPTLAAGDGGSQEVIAHAPLSADGSLALASVSAWEAAAAVDAKTQLARTILVHSDIRSALLRREAMIKDTHVFNTELDFKTGPVTNQKSSGRCWLFATTNVLRYQVMKKLNLKEFQLSQNYLFFWDKLNKSNYYLELSIQHAETPLDDRLISHLSGDLISDGGQWDMVVNLLETYGMVPQPVYPESTHSSLSSPLNSLLKTKLREHSLVLRKLSAALRSSSTLSESEIVAMLRSKKEELLKEVYTVMSATLGVPPHPDAKFVWDYYDKDGKAGTWEGTAREFYKSFANKQYPVSDSFSLIHDPRNPYSKLYTVDKLGNVWSGRPVLYVNTEIENLKDAIVKMLKAGQPVFFGCDVGKFSENQSGIMDTDLYGYENAFDISLSLTKAERLQTMESAMTHAMVISGVHLDPKTSKPVRYKVENSWGETSGDKGYFVMTDRWFEQFVYQVVVHKALAPKDLVKVFEGDEKTVLPPWDPMGSLA
ncbi:hypothetical protein EW146_g3445 [Bondarzewia mesenterica]|uniref:Cysteine proteinase 1, mitochondrial n=1 Tax=Bondarzewia mesenterica TaxID=1095465 RepID=A0A4S4LXH1_9AGAM|nr:hypothetical protein EW146_g3445 [Bondarzewia mesenterica]